MKEGSSGSEIAGAGVQDRVHPLSHDPDRCYAEEETQSRYTGLQSVPASKPVIQPDNTIRFVCIADTHGRDGMDTLHERIPSGDVLVHAGDFCGHYHHFEKEIQLFDEFLGRLKPKFKHILVIAGNQEMSFDEATWEQDKKRGSITPQQSRGLITNGTYLQDESTEVLGAKVYGSPWQPMYSQKSFSVARGADLLTKWDMIPTDIDVLITHAPPLGIGDQNWRNLRSGCAELLTTVLDRVRPKLHIFGHIHEGYGMWKNECTTFINASMSNKNYQLANEPVVFDFPLPVPQDS